MSNISQSYFAKYRYFITGPYGILYISEPVGWNDDDKVLKRSEDAHGVFTSLSNNLEFYRGDSLNDGGYDYLKKVYEEFGINAKVQLNKEENVSGVWEELYRGYFDFSTYSREEYYIKIKFNESGLYELIKSRGTEELEVDRLTTMDGNPVDEMKVETVALDGRKILIINSLKVKTSKVDENVNVATSKKMYIRKDYSWGLMNYGNANNYNAIAFPMEMVTEQSGDVQTIYDYDVRIDRDANIIESGETGYMFYAISDNDKTLKIDIDLEISAFGQDIPDDMKILLVRYKDGIKYLYKNQISLLNVGTVVRDQRYKVQLSAYEVPMLTGESLALVMYARFTGAGDVRINFFKTNLTVYDETYYEKTQSNFVLPFETLSRIIEIITNKKGGLRSKALGRTELGYAVDGEASLTGLTNGFWVRQFNTEKITTSFMDFMDSFKAIWQLGYAVERNGFEEVVKVENISYFYQDFVGIKLGGVPSKIKRSCEAKLHYSGIEIGYSQPSGSVLYEEALGLDEYNIVNNYTTPITRVQNKFISVSKYRADSYGTEFARRKPKKNYPEEDTRYDLSVMVLDLKRGVGSLFEQRKWADDFVVPVPFNSYTAGIYSPETATNLRFSPINTLQRWGFWLKGSLLKNLTEKIRYSSSVGNTKLKTQSLIPGSKEYAESGDIDCVDLNRNLFVADTIEFTFQVDDDLLRQLYGKTVVNGEQVMNYYGLVEFTNELGELEYGYLMSVEPNNEGKWKLLTSNKRTVKQQNNNYGVSKIIGPSNLVAIDATVKP
jgi:hypothetical protein